MSGGRVIHAPEMGSRELRVSFITTVYNDERFCRECIASVLGQSFAEFEMIIVDDGSTDGTSAILGEISDPRVRVLSRPRLRRARALNVAIEAATGDYLAILDSDDVAAPDRLQLQVDYLERHPEVGMVGSSTCILIDEDGAITRTRVSVTTDHELRRLLYRCNPFHHSSVTYRAAALKAAGGFDEQLRHSIDLDLYLRIAEHWELGNIAEVACYKRIHDHQYFRWPVGAFSRFSQLTTGLRMRRRATVRIGAPVRYSCWPFVVYAWSLLRDAAKRVIRVTSRVENRFSELWGLGSRSSRAGRYSPHAGRGGNIMHHPLIPQPRPLRGVARGTSARPTARGIPTRP